MFSLGLWQSCKTISHSSGKIFNGPLTRHFSNSSGRPGASSLPGFLTAERVEELNKLPNLMPESLRAVFPIINQNHMSSNYIPDLTKVQTVREASIFSFNQH